MIRRLLILMLVTAGGCALETSVISTAADTGAGRDSGDDGGGGRPDTGARDGGPCAPGTFDANGDPTDGCECVPTSPSNELCDGIDNDCDPATADGSGDSNIGVACDGSDLDMCPEGTRMCIGGRAVCDDPTGNSGETCNGMDDDCDGSVDEGVQLQLYLDGDGDGLGRDDDVIASCEPVAGRSATGGDCNDSDPAVGPGLPETCNWRDDDCDGTLDEGVGCVCVGEPHAGRLYAFCAGSETWSDAGGRCGDLGMTLAALETPAEDAWILLEVRTRGLGQPWVGLHDLHDEMQWVWWDDTPVDFTNWATGEPNDGGIGRIEDCGVINHGGDANSWNDTQCDDRRNWVCEGPLP